jgi:fumarate reductase subunit C
MRLFLFVIVFICLLGILRNFLRRKKSIRFTDFKVVVNIVVLLLVLGWALYMDSYYLNNPKVKVIAGKADIIEAATIYHGNYAFYYDHVTGQVKFNRGEEECRVCTPDFNRWYAAWQERQDTGI